MSCEVDLLACGWHFGYYVQNAGLSVQVESRTGHRLDRSDLGPISAASDVELHCQN